jgi:WD40 repeat protein
LQGRDAEAAAFSPDGSLLAVGHDDSGNSRFLTVYNTSTWDVVFGGPDPTVENVTKSLAFSPDSALLAVGTVSSGNQPFIYNTSTWTRVTGTPDPGAAVTGISFSPSGALMALGISINPKLRVYNTSDWSLVAGVPAFSGTAPGDVKFSPNGSFLAFLYTIAPRFAVINTSDWSVRSDTPSLSINNFRADWAPDSLRLAIQYGNASPGPAVVGLSTASPWWWTGSAWSASETFITSSAETLSIPAAAWDDIL